MIYFIQQGKSGPIKIGYTSKDDIGQRMSTLQSSSHEMLVCLGILQGDDKQEKLLHQFFHAYKIRGEWFEPHPKLLIYIMGLILGKSDIDMINNLTQVIDTEYSPIVYELNGMEIDEYLQKQEINILKRTLSRTQWNIAEAAKQLNISYRSIRHRIAKYKLQKKISIA